MITVYDSKTGEPVELDSVDARERVNAGLAVRSLYDVHEEKKKPGPKPKANKPEDK